MIAKSQLFDLAKALDGIAVLGCLAGTPAALAGVVYGDILLSVNGRRTRTFAEFVEAKALRTDGMSVVIFRSGEERPLTLEYEMNRPPADPLVLLGELISMRVVPGEIEGDDPVS